MNNRIKCTDGCSSVPTSGLEVLDVDVVFVFMWNLLQISSWLVCRARKHITPLDNSRHRYILMQFQLPQNPTLYATASRLARTHASEQSWTQTGRKSTTCKSLHRTSGHIRENIHDVYMISKECKISRVDGRYAANGTQDETYAHDAKIRTAEERFTAALYHHTTRWIFMRVIIKEKELTRGECPTHELQLSWCCSQWNCIRLKGWQNFQWGGIDGCMKWNRCHYLA